MSDPHCSAKTLHFAATNTSVDREMSKDSCDRHLMNVLQALEAGEDAQKRVAYLQGYFQGYVHKDGVQPYSQEQQQLNIAWVEGLRDGYDAQQNNSQQR